VPIILLPCLALAGRVDRRFRGCSRSKPPESFGRRLLDPRPDLLVQRLPDEIEKDLLLSGLLVQLSLQRQQLPFDLGLVRL
jgi:hypothetical protein